MDKIPLFLMVRTININGKNELVLRAVPRRVVDHYLERGWKHLEEVLDDTLFAYK